MYIILRLLKLVALAAVAFILYKVLWKGESIKLPFFKRRKKKTGGSSHPQAAVEEMKKDPVCGTYIPVKEAFTYKKNGETYYFCSGECKEKFQKLSSSRS
jgi:YHS domain-containing protein